MWYGSRCYWHSKDQNRKCPCLYQLAIPFPTSTPEPQWAGDLHTSGLMPARPAPAADPIFSILDHKQMSLLYSIIVPGEGKDSPTWQAHLPLTYNIVLTSHSLGARIHQASLEPEFWPPDDGGALVKGSFLSGHPSSYQAFPGQLWGSQPTQSSQLTLYGPAVAELIVSATELF